MRLEVFLHSVCTRALIALIETPFDVWSSFIIRMDIRIRYPNRYGYEPIFVSYAKLFREANSYTGYLFRVLLLKIKSPLRCNFLRPSLAAHYFSKHLAIYNCMKVWPNIMSMKYFFFDGKFGDLNFKVR